MSHLLDRAIAEVRRLPDGTQDEIAALIFEEIEDDRLWEEAFDRNPGKLASLVARAADQVRAGECRTAGFDDL